MCYIHRGTPNVAIKTSEAQIAMYKGFEKIIVLSAKIGFGTYKASAVGARVCDRHNIAC